MDKKSLKIKKMAQNLNCPLGMANKPIVQYTPFTIVQLYSNSLICGKKIHELQS
jgi:hypothetical protein